VVHAVSPLLLAFGEHAEHFARLRRQVEQRTTAITGRPRNAYNVVIERGLPHALLARLALANDALLVIGAHMHHGLGHALLKDVTERVVERACGPVLVTKPGADAGPVLVAVEPPFESSASLDLAVEEARATGAELAVLHCVDSGRLHMLPADLLNGAASFATKGSHPGGTTGPAGRDRTPPNQSRNLAVRGRRPLLDRRCGTSDSRPLDRDRVRTRQAIARCHQRSLAVCSLFSARRRQPFGVGSRFGARCGRTELDSGEWERSLGG